MAVGTISTFAIFQSTLNDVSKTEGDLTNLQNQLSSGNKSNNFAGISSQSAQYLDLESKISTADQYVNNNTLVSTQLDGTNTALTQVITIATNLQNLIATQRTGTSSNSDFSTQLQSQWQALTAALNSTSNGQYLFSGTATNMPAVDSTNFPASAETGATSPTYYTGSSQDMSVRAEDGVQFNYNVRADAPAFQQLFAGLAMASQGVQGGGDTDLASAVSLVQQGLQGVITLQSTVNANKVQLTSINTNLGTYKLYWQGVQQNIGNTDLVSVSTQVAVDQGVLQAAFQAFAKITSLRLSTYLQ